MDREDLIVFMKSIAEWSVKEGPPFSPESLLSNLEVVNKALGSAKPPSPTQRHALATERHIEDVCKERDRIAKELGMVHESHAIAIREMRREHAIIVATHRDRLDWIEPQYEGLKRDYDNIKSLNFSSLTMITFGGILIGTASFLTWDVPKFSALASGTLATLYGLWTQGLIVYKSSASKERPVARQSVS